MAKSRLPFVPIVVTCLLLVTVGRVHAQTTSHDLRDAAQYRAFVDRLTKADVTPANHAALFKRLEAARSKPGVAGPAGPIQVANFIVDVATTDGDNFTATGVSTTPGGSDYTMLILQLYNDADVPIGPAASLEQFGNGVFANVTARGALGPEPKSRNVRAILTTYVEPRTGSPRAETSLAEGGVLPDRITNTAPKASSNPDLIRVCVGRSSKSCDYSSPRLAKFPVKGKVVFPGTIDRIKYDSSGKPRNANLTLLLADATGGGACSAVTAATFFKKYATIQGNTLTWSIDPANFGECYPRDGRLVIGIGVTVKGTPAFVSVADIETKPTRTTVAIPPIAVIRGMPVAGKLTAQEKSDMRHVIDQHKRNGDVDLDLRDPANYRFMVRQFERAGYTRGRYPQLFGALDGLAKSGPVALAAKITVDNPTEALNTIIEVKTNDQKSFAAEALSSIPGGTVATMLNLGVYNENDDPIGPVTEKKDFKGGTDVTIHADGAYETPTPTEGRLVQAVGSYFYEDAAGGHHAGPMTATFAFYPKKIQDDAPIAIKNPAQVVVCLNRTVQNGDCDYDCSTGLNCTKQPPNDWQVRFPLKGYVDYYKNIDVGPDGKPAGATSRIVTTFTQSGGACKLPLTDFFANPNTRVENGNRLVWSIDPAVFGNACYPGKSDVTYAFMVNVYTEGTPISAYINNTGGTPEQNTFKIPPMKVYQGCLAPGSKITLANGTDQVIESLDGGERLKSDAGRVLTVAGTTFGRESNPLVKIETKDGRVLLLTDEHAVPTKNGMRLARQLASGDVVYTTGGPSALVSVERKPYNGKVHNLEVGTPADDVKLTNENRTFYANGILVGDSEMQDYWARTVSKNEAKKTLPPQWLTDYRSAQEDANKKHQP